VAIAVTVNRIGFGYRLGAAMVDASRWKGVVDNIYIDENYHHGAIEYVPGKRSDAAVWDGAPRLCPRRIAKSIQLRKGIVQGEPHDIYPSPGPPKSGRAGRRYRMWMMDNLNNYVIAQLDFDTSQDVETLIADYCRDLYGPAAAEVEAFLTKLEHRWTEMPARLGVKDYKHTSLKLRGRMFDTCWGKIYPPGFVDEVFGHLAQAEALAQAAENKVYLRRVRLLQRGFALMKEKSALYRRLAASQDPRR
jgi:hypothetical protein